MDAFRASAHSVTNTAPLARRSNNRLGPATAVDTAANKKMAVAPAGLLQKQLVVPGAQVLAASSSSPQRYTGASDGRPQAQEKQTRGEEEQLPAFLRRRSQKDANASSPTASLTGQNAVEDSRVQQKAEKGEGLSLREAYAAEMRRRGIEEEGEFDVERMVGTSSDEDDDDDEPPLIVDDDEDADAALLSEKELMAMADDMTATTGLSQVEVIALLREFEEKKKAAIAQKKNPRAFFTEPEKVKKPKKKGAPATIVPAVQPPLVLPKLSAEVAFPGDEQPSNDGPHQSQVPASIEESEHDRTQRLLQELLGSPQRDRVSDEDHLPLDGEMSSFEALRKQRAMERHQAVTNYLAAKRQGTFRPPLASAVDEKYVQAYKAQLARRLQKASERKAQKRREQEEEQRVRREKGFLSNLAIRKQIELSAEAKKKEREEMDARVARLRESEAIWDV